MSNRNWQRYIQGQVTLLVSGRQLERFINAANDCGVRLWDVERLSDESLLLKTAAENVWKMRPIARDCQVKFKIAARQGLPFLWKRLQKRRFMLIGCLVFIIALNFGSSLIWTIEVTGNEKYSAAEVCAAAEPVGVKKGNWLHCVDTERTAAFLERELPEVDWVSVALQGTRVQIELKEQKLPSTENLALKQPADVVAAKAGIIEEILVLAGQVMVETGDTVQAGQILISGTITRNIAAEQEATVTDELGQGAAEENSAEEELLETSYVHAQGMIKARVWYSGYAEVALQSESITETGESLLMLRMKIGTKEIMLKGSKTVPYASYYTETDVKEIPLWRKINLPVEVHMIRCLETEKNTVSLTYEQAKQQAEQQALDILRQQIPEEAEILHQKTEVITVANEDQLVRVRATAEVLENIGQKADIEKQ